MAYYLLKDQGGSPQCVPLNGVGGAGNEVTVAIPTDAFGQSLVIEPQLWTNNTYRILVHFDAIPGLLNNMGRLKDNDSALFMPAGYSKVHLIVTDSSGNLQNGGANDIVMLRFSAGHQVF